jgi:hypothetical protein
MVSGQHDQGLVQANPGIDETKQVGQGAVQMQDVVFALEAGGSEDMADIVGRGKAYSKVVGFIVAAEVLVLDKGLGKVEGQFVPSRTYG